MQKKTEDAILNKTAGAGERVSLWALFWEFLKIGSFTIGGGAAMLPQLQQDVIDKGWLDPDETLDAIALSQSLPGLTAVNIGVYVGYKKRGLAGAFLASLGVVIPAFVAIIVAVGLLDYIGDNPIINGAFMGIKAAVCGLIIVTSVKFLKQIVRRDNRAAAGAAGWKATAGTVFAIALCVITLVAVGFLGVTAILLILIGILAGIVFYRCVQLDRGETAGNGGTAGSEETAGDGSKGVSDK